VQYLTDLHAAHAFRLIPASSPLPQLAHKDILFSESDAVLI